VRSGPRRLRIYVFVILDIATRRALHWNLTVHPTAEWTIQQFRDGLPLDDADRVRVHDRDGIFAPAVDEAGAVDVTARAEDAGPHVTSERAL